MTGKKSFMILIIFLVFAVGGGTIAAASSPASVTLYEARVLIAPNRVIPFPIGEDGSLRVRDIFLLIADVDPSARLYWSPDSKVAVMTQDRYVFWFETKTGQIICRDMNYPDVAAITLDGCYLRNDRVMITHVAALYDLLPRLYLNWSEVRDWDGKSTTHITLTIKPMPAGG